MCGVNDQNEKFSTGLEEKHHLSAEEQNTKFSFQGKLKKINTYLVNTYCLHTDSSCCCEENIFSLSRSMGVHNVTKKQILR